MPRLSDDQTRSLRALFDAELRRRVASLTRAADRSAVDEIYTITCEILELVDQFRMSEAQLDEVRRDSRPKLDP